MHLTFYNLLLLLVLFAAAAESRSDPRYQMGGVNMVEDIGGRYGQNAYGGEKDRQTFHGELSIQSDLLTLFLHFTATLFSITPSPFIF